MRSTIEELSKELSELRALIASITPVTSALVGHHDSVVRRYLTIRRRFDYAAFVVALYASFEEFCENLVASYARLIALRSDYSDLPERLVRKHMSKSAEILAWGRAGEGRYLGIREIDLVKNLFDCLSGTSPYTLNDVAIVAHDLNLRYGELNSLFAAVGIEKACEHARRADEMVKWFCTSNGLANPPQEGVPLATIQQRIEDLVERRNQVTHRGGSPVNLLGPAEMTEMVDFIEALATSVFALAVAAYLRGRYASSTEAGRLQLLSGPLKNRTVVVVARPARRLYVGQPAFAFVDGSGVRWGRILDLQVNDVSTTAVGETSTAAEVGVFVSFTCPKSGDLFVLDTDDDVVWSPAS